MFNTRHAHLKCKNTFILIYWLKGQSEGKEIKVRKGEKTGRKGLTYEDFKEIIIHLISMFFTIYIYIYIYIYI